MSKKIKEQYKSILLSMVLEKAEIKDKEYWREKIEEECKGAEERGLEEDDYGWDLESDMWCLLEDWDRNGD